MNSSYVYSYVAIKNKNGIHRKRLYPKNILEFLQTFSSRPT